MNKPRDWGVPFFDEWVQVLKVNSFTDKGKKAWAKACSLEDEFKERVVSYSRPNLHPDEYRSDDTLLMTYKNRLFYSFL